MSRLAQNWGSAFCSVVGERENRMKFKHALEGRAASPGQVSGIARLVRTPAEAANVQPQHIMVVEMTTPDYVAAMRQAAGIIAAKGGATSHAAVVAREMNKPCIVSVGEALTLIEEGNHVAMDGGTGQIRVFTPEPQDAAHDSTPAGTTYTPPAPYRSPSPYQRGGD